MQPTLAAPAPTAPRIAAQTCVQTGTLRLCKDCTHHIHLDARRIYGSHDRCTHPVHGHEPVNGAALDADCADARHRRGFCGPDGGLFEARASVHHEVAGQPAQALAVGGPVGGAGGGNARVVVQVYALGAGVALKGEGGGLPGSEGAFELEAPRGTLVFDPLQAGVADWFVAPVESDVTPVGQALQYADEEDGAELGDGFSHGGPGAGKTVILSLPAGWGKTMIAPQLAERLGCGRIVDEWSPARPITPCALHLTNATVALGDDPAPAAQTPAPPTSASTPAALPITIRFIEWRCGHHGQRPDDIPAASREQAQLILQAIGYAISQPGHARAAVFDDNSGTTVYLTDDYAEEIKPGWPSRTVLYHATPDQLAELRRPELARAWDDCYGGELREWDGAALLDDEMEWVTTQDVAAITQALTPVAWHEEGQRREVCQVPPVLKPAAELLAELREAARETAQYEADLAADRAAELEGGAS